MRVRVTHFTHSPLVAPSPTGPASSSSLYFFYSINVYLKIGHPNWAENSGTDLGTGYGFHTRPIEICKICLPYINTVSVL